jgi:ketosteroid isomerase-like protein
MAREDVDVITRMYEAWNGGDVIELLKVFDDEVEVRPALGAMLSSTVYTGRDGVAAWYSETYEPWADLRAEPQRFIDAGERTVVVVGLHARVAGGKVDVEAEIGHVLTVRNGRIARLDGYETPAAALEAVGLEA